MQSIAERTVVAYKVNANAPTDTLEHLASSVHCRVVKPPAATAPSAAAPPAPASATAPTAALIIATQIILVGRTAPVIRVAK